MYYPKGKGRADRIVRRLAVPQAFGDDLLKSYNVQFNGTDIMGTFILNIWKFFPLKLTCPTRVADIFFKLCINQYSAPDSILVDRGQTFLSKVLQEICKRF